ncbi:MAG: hypothetical protein WAZ77_22120 [Candidatus Nitrosopolaris sp.]
MTPASAIFPLRACGRFIAVLLKPYEARPGRAQFLGNAKANPEWAQINLIQFISYQNERAKGGEISVSTIPNC